MKEELEFLATHREMAFATVGEDQKPKLRAFQWMKMDGTTLFFATSPHKEVFRQLQSNPNVELLIMSGNISMRMNGKAVFDVEEAIRKEIFDSNAVLSRLYPDYKSLVYFRVQIEQFFLF